MMIDIKLGNRDRFKVVCIFSVLFFSCSSSSHSETNDTSYELPRCETSREVYELEDITPLSYTAQELIDMLFGTWQCDELEWYDLDSVGVLYPEEKPNEVTVTQSYEGGDIVYIRSERVGGENFDFACSSQLEIPTVITLESSDGFFSETLNLTAVIGNYPLSSEVDHEEKSSRAFNGTYKFEPNTELQALPDSGTVISFTSRLLKNSKAGANGYIVEYFWSDEILMNTDPPTYDSWGASFSIVTFVCQDRDIDTFVSEEIEQ